ncbi:MAG: uroporphyrin-III C-methyltransferase [Thermoleophilia bacterium]|nr:uroporphyrin-III C-methyltransferase [Thermoleophilia bacterium]
MSGAARPGTVYLVGAGPGDPGLVTRRALELVRSADVLLIDRLVPVGLADEAPAAAERIDVGKVAGNHAMAQDDINARLVAEAQAGRRVVRLKGGDPYLFGRGGEEALACREAGVPFEVVPAVTSAFSACADAGIPVTHRDIARHVTVVTASAGRDGQGDPDYGWLAQSDGTVVLLMGLRRVAHVAAALIAGGAPPDRPAAVVARGTTAAQRTVVATLATLAEAVGQAALPSPAIIVVGDVVALRDGLDWFEQRPLFGTRVAVTRARAQASSLVARLADLGAEVVEAPAIRIEPLPVGEVDAAVDSLDDAHVLAFTSANGVERFFERLAARGRDARALSGLRVAVVGTASADACRRHGVEPDVIPPVGARTGAGLVDSLTTQGVEHGTLVVVVRAEAGDEALVDGLRAHGAHVHVARAYRTVVEPPSADLVAQLRDCDLVTFTSASTVHHLVEAAAAHGIAVGDLPPAISIGPTTTAAAEAAGLHVRAQAAEPSVASLVEALVADRAR